MSTYVLLLTLNTEGRRRMLTDPDSLRRAENETEVPGVQCLGLYAVLGPYDFVTILDAPDNEAAAGFSLELGVRAGAHITTLPAVPVGLLQREEPRSRGSESTEAAPPVAPGRYTTASTLAGEHLGNGG